MTGLIEGRVLPLAGSLRAPMRWLIVMTSVPFIVVVVVLTLIFLRADPTRAPVPIAALFLIPALVLFAQLALVRGMARASVAIAHGDLVVNTGLGMKRVPLSRLRRRGVRVVDLAAHPELRPALRLWGTGLPGYGAGWFRLRNGEKAVCLLLERNKVCYLRSDEDRLSLLLSLEDPDALRAALDR
jgi:hypothetical protein